MSHPHSAVTTTPHEKPDGPVYGKSLFRVNEPLPGVLYLDDLAAILGISRASAFRLQRRDQLAPFEMRPRIGIVARYSGKKVQQWLDGETAGPQLRYFRSK